MTGYNIPILLFERGLALCNFLAFFSFHVQLRGFVLSRGITPAKLTMDKRRHIWVRNWKEALTIYPSVFWFSTSDTFIQLVSYTGLICSILAFFGVFPAINILICMILYNSERSIGQPWLGLQMHATIIETNFLYLLCSPFKEVYPYLMVFCCRFLTWRIMLGCGACKYSTGDRSWRDLTAMSYHYETQPLPNPVSWYIHNLPMWFHKFAAVATHVVEGPVAFLCFGTEWMRIFAFINFTALTLMINSTGNYGFLGILTTVQTFPLLDDSFYHQIAPSWFPEPKDVETPWAIVIAAWIVAFPYLATSIVPLWSTFRGEIPWKTEFLHFLTHTRYNSLNQMVSKVNEAVDSLYEKVVYSDFMEKTFFRFYSWLEWLEELVSPFRVNC